MHRLTAQARAGLSHLALAVVALSLAACAGVPETRGSEARLDLFGQALSANYAYLAQSLKGHDAELAGTRETLREIFVRKAATESAAAEQPLPSIAGSDIARAQLNTAFAAGAPLLTPKSAARAQAAYDCWVLNTRAGRARAAALCKQAFDTALNLTELALNPAAIPDAAPIATAEAQSGYTVYFGFDEWNLSGGALQTITNAVQAAHDSRVGHIEVAGYTDAAGPAPYNLTLSARRAKVVREVMIEMGARPPAVAAEGEGERDPAVPTRDGVREAGNRRSVITLIPMESRVSAR